MMSDIFNGVSARPSRSFFHRHHSRRFTRSSGIGQKRASERSVSKFGSTPIARSISVA